MTDVTVMVHGWWKKGDSDEAEAATEDKFEHCDAQLDDSSDWNDHGYSLQSVHFIGAAVDDEYPTQEYEPGYYGVRNQTDETHNYYSEEDDTLDWVYNSYEWDQALGETGRESGNTTPGNYADFDATDQVGRDHSGYLDHCSDEIVAHVS